MAHLANEQKTMDDEIDHDKSVDAAALRKDYASLEEKQDALAKVQEN
jgi:hypothetical protein